MGYGGGCREEEFARRYRSAVVGFGRFLDSVHAGVAGGRNVFGGSGEGGGVL